MKIKIIVEITDEQWEDPEHEMGITNEAFERLATYTTEYGPGPLEWLGEVTDVVKVEG